MAAPTDVTAWNTTTAAQNLGDLEDWGFRAGAGEGECKISGIFLCKVLLHENSSYHL